MNVSNLLKVDLTPAQVTVSFLLAFALAYIWATVYKRTHSGVAYTQSFFFSLILIPPIVAMIMMAIGSNVALSLGLVGSLSVLRFRSVIKDPRDMTFLFLAIGIGLCSGASTWMIGIIGTFLISMIAILMSKLGTSKPGSSDYILIFRSDQKEPWEAINSEARSMIRWKQLRGATDMGQGKEFEYTYSVRFTKKTQPEKIVSRMSSDFVRNVTLITPENHLEL